MGLGQFRYHSFVVRWFIFLVLVLKIAGECSTENKRRKRATILLEILLSINSNLLVETLLELAS